MSHKESFKYYYWGPLLTKCVIDDNLKKGLLEKAKKNIKDARSDLAGILKKETSFSDEDMSWFIKNFYVYLKDHMSFLSNWHNKDYSKNNLRLDSLWINYMKNNEFNPPHIHKGDFSFVIYLKIPEKLKKENENYIGTDECGPGGIRFINDMKNQKLHVSDHCFFPKENDCFVFPSSLYHMVYPFNSKCERISVSGNLYLE